MHGLLPTNLMDYMVNGHSWHAASSKHRPPSVEGTDDQMFQQYNQKNAPRVAAEIAGEIILLIFTNMIE
jgi:hypothetical protein